MVADLGGVKRAGSGPGIKRRPDLNLRRLGGNRLPYQRGGVSGPRGEGARGAAEGGVLSSTRRASPPPPRPHRQGVRPRSPLARARRRARDAGARGGEERRARGQGGRKRRKKGTIKREEKGEKREGLASEHVRVRGGQREERGRGGVTV